MVGFRRFFLRLVSTIGSLIAVWLIAVWLVAAGAADAFVLQLFQGGYGALGGFQVSASRRADRIS